MMSFGRDWNFLETVPTAESAQCRHQDRHHREHHDQHQHLSCARRDPDPDADPDAGTINACPMYIKSFIT